MPSKSKAQHNFMAAVAHNPAFAKKAGVPQSVGKEFNEADKGRKFSKGGDMKNMNMGGYASGGMPMVMKDGKKVPAFAADGKGKMAGGGMAKSKMMAGGGMMKSKMMASDGMHMMPDGKMMKDSAMKKMSMGGMANGGSASKRADGIAIKGKTKGTMLKQGGKVKC